MKPIQKVWWILKRNDGKILIFQEFSRKRNGYFWNIVKWTVEEKDKTPYDTLVREIFEETGLSDVILWQLFGTFPQITGNTTTLLSIYMVEVWGDGSDVSNKNMMDDESIREYRWIDENSFEAILKEDFIDERIYCILEKYFILQ